MNEFWAIHTSGFLDMRGAVGPSQTMEEAMDRCGFLSTFERNGFSPPREVNVGDWFAVHRDGAGTGEEMTMVDGPYGSKEMAEFQRKRNIEDEESFEIDCGRQVGFVAEVVAVLSHNRAVVRR